ncbi:MAG: AMP-binding protein [Propionibacteriales bacterium]|nr:AMP-binding protein [Propionibacteriales bacterium]
MSYSDRPLPEMVVAKLLAGRAATTPDAPFVRFGDAVVTYGEMHRRAKRYASALQSVGLGRGDLVAIMMQNSIDYIAVYFGLVYRGAAVVLVNTAFRGYMLEYVLNDAGCQVMVVDSDLVPAVRESQPGLGALRRILVTGGAGTSTPEGDQVVDLSAAVSGSGEAEPDLEVGYADLHCVVYSSGTTGPSKGIMISNGHAVAKAFEVIRICQFTASDVLYSPLPLFYSMGLLRGVLSVALLGASIVLRDRFSVSAYWDDVRQHSVTVAHSVFSLPRMLITAPLTPRDRDHKLRCMYNARHDPGFTERFGVRLIEGYGLTEAGNAIFSRVEQPPVPESCGQVSDEWDVRLADPDGNEVPVGGVGEILIRPRQPQRIMMGYLNKPEATAAATCDLWLHTGDLAAMDEKGYYFYKGRIKDMIRRRGQNISAWEVEQVIREHPGVGEAAALPHPSEVGDDDLRVVISPAEGASVDLVEVARYCEQRLPDFMVPRYLEVLAELPRTPSGRVEKYRLAEQPLGDGALDRGPDPRRRRPAQ